MAHGTGLDHRSQSMDAGPRQSQHLLRSPQLHQRAADQPDAGQRPPQYRSNSSPYVGAYQRSPQMDPVRPRPQEIDRSFNLEEDQFHPHGAAANVAPQR